MSFRKAIKKRRSLLKRGFTIDQSYLQSFGRAKDRKGSRVSLYIIRCAFYIFEHVRFLAQTLVPSMDCIVYIMKGTRHTTRTVV